MNNRRFAYNLKASANNPKKGELLIYDIISSDDGFWTSPDDITPKNLRKSLDDMGDINLLDIFINSDGGDAYAAIAIHSILSRLQAQKTVYIDGLAASSASLIAMAGDKIIMPAGAQMMVHKPWTINMGNADDFRKSADDMDICEKSMNVIYQGKTGLKEDEITDLLRAETWMTADDAVKLGFADEIEESKKIVACVKGKILMLNGREFDLSGYKNNPFKALATIYNGVNPGNVSEKKAPEDEEWNAPALKDFTNKLWDKLTDEEKRHIAGHFAWAAKMPPDTFGDLKFPHHDPKDGDIVWRGVANGAARLDQSDLSEEDKGIVKDHLGAHYKQFGKTSPWETNKPDEKQPENGLLSSYQAQIEANKKRFGGKV